MPSRAQRAQQQAARAASRLTFKKRRLNAAEPSPLSEHQSEPFNRISTSLNDTKSDTESESDVESDSKPLFFWYDSANESDSDSEEEGHSDVEEEKSATEQTVIPPVELKWNKEGEQALRGTYGKGSRSTSKRQRKSAKESAKQASESYNIMALWQRSKDSDLSEIPRGRPLPLTAPQVFIKKRVEALRDLDRLLENVTEQEKKYGDRLAPQSNYYRRHTMVQNFLQYQIKTQQNPVTRFESSLHVANSFKRGRSTARNIVQWENSWVDTRQIAERQENRDCTSWMYDPDVSDAIRNFARTTGEKLSSYKLVQFLKGYIDPKGTPTPITIRSRTARTWLNKLGFEYKEVRKGVFIDGHERPDVVEDRKIFLKRMDELRPYMVEFEEDGTMKDKIYPPNCVVGGTERRPVIVITHDECTFSANDRIRRAWTRKGDTFLRPKGRGQGIMTSEFILPFGRLNLASLTPEKKAEVVAQSGLTETEAVEIFEYGKNNDGYWDGVKLHKQVVSKALPIAEALYPGYSLLFLFDNATSHSVYAKDALQVNDMNKGSGGKQNYLRHGWFDCEGSQTIQPMSVQDANGKWIQKGIQKVLEERNLWPAEGLNLECSRPKCFNCQAIADCQLCVKGRKCDLCKAPRQHSSHNCSKNRRCDACVHRDEQCQCVPKKHCLTCSAKKGKCADCQDLPPKCSTNSCCARRLLSVQPDFMAQKCEIEESITQSTNGKHHIVLYYPKYHCKLNHIEHFWCSAKQWARENCQYSLDDLRRRVPLALASVPNHTILAYYHRCQNKMKLYQEGIGYGSSHWKAHTAHHKPTNKDEDR